MCATVSGVSGRSCVPRCRMVTSWPCSTSRRRIGIPLGPVPPIMRIRTGLSLSWPRENPVVTTKLLLDVRPLTPTIGAEVRGVDLSAELDDDTVAALRALWLDRLVLFFPEQQLTNETQLEFASRLSRNSDPRSIRS